MYRVNGIPVRISVAFFTDPKIHMEAESTPLSQNNLEQKLGSILIT